MHNTTKMAAALFMALAASALPTAAQTVYRCGDSYSQTPCHGGQVIDVEDSRSAIQRSQTLAATQRDTRLANAMEKMRLDEEAKAEAARLTQQRAEAAAKSSRGKGKDAGSAMAKSKDAKPKKPADFTAIAPGTGKSKPARKPRTS
jgi:hypothetical protein